MLEIPKKPNCFTVIIRTDILSHLSVSKKID